MGHHPDSVGRIPRRRLKTGLATLTLLAMTAAACGSHHDRAELLAAASGAEGGQVIDGGNGGTPTAVSDGDGSTVGQEAVGNDTAGVAPGASGPGATGGAPGASGPGATGGGPDSAAGLAPGRPVLGSLPPIKIGQIGPMSGLIGASLVPSYLGARVWVRYINDRGGLNGAKVELLTADDNTDPAKHRALTQDFIDNKGVQAFLMNGTTLSGQSAVPVIEDRQVPVVGSEGGSDYFYSSPMYFPQMSHGDELVRMLFGASGQVAQSTGEKRFGGVYCQEAQICADGERLQRSDAAKFGLESVYTAQASLAKPDFTAECLNARDAGVQILAAVGDFSYVSRVAASCARQKYFPTFALIASTTGPSHQDNPSFKKLIVASAVAPFFDVSIPAVKEYRDAMARYAPGSPMTTGTMDGWVAGKLLERAGRDITAPTSKQILKGLYGIKQDTLAGLTGPLTFTAGANASRFTCWWALDLTSSRAQSALPPACA